MINLFSRRFVLNTLPSGLPSNTDSVMHSLVTEEQPLTVLFPGDHSPYRAARPRSQCCPHAFPCPPLRSAVPTHCHFSDRPALHCGHLCDHVIVPLTHDLKTRCVHSHLTIDECPVLEGGVGGCLSPPSFPVCPCLTPLCGGPAARLYLSRRPCSLLCQLVLRTDRESSDFLVYCLPAVAARGHKTEREKSHLAQVGKHIPPWREKSFSEWGHMARGTRAVLCVFMRQCCVWPSIYTSFKIF